MYKESFITDKTIARPRRYAMQPSRGSPDQLIRNKRQSYSSQFDDNCIHVQNHINARSCPYFSPCVSSPGSLKQITFSKNLGKLILVTKLKFQTVIPPALFPRTKVHLLDCSSTTRLYAYLLHPRSRIDASWLMTQHLYFYHSFKTNTQKCH